MTKFPKVCTVQKLNYYNYNGHRLELNGFSLVRAAEMLLLGTRPEERDAFIEALRKKNEELKPLVV